MTDTNRMFIAIPVNDNIKEKLDQIRNWMEHNTPEGINVNWEPKDNYHITLRFLGDVDYDQYARLKWADDVNPIEPFKLTLADVGFFGEWDNPTVLWSGIGGATSKLHMLYDHVNKIVWRAGFPEADFIYTPHITLGRIKADPQYKHRDNMKKWINGIPNVYYYYLGDTEFVVDRVQLLLSLKSANGVKYEVVSEGGLIEHYS